MDINPNLNRINTTTQLVAAASSGTTPVKLPFTEVIKAAFSTAVEKIPRRYRVILLVATAVLLISITKLWNSFRQKTHESLPKPTSPATTQISNPVQPPAASPKPRSTTPVSITPPALTLPPATSVEPTPHVPRTDTTPPITQTMSPSSAATSPKVNEEEKNEKKRDEPDELPPTIHLPLRPCGSSASASNGKAKILSQRPAGLTFTSDKTKEVIEHIEGYPFASSIKEENRHYPEVIPQMSPDELAYMYKLLIIRRAESYINTKSWSMFREEGDQQAFDQNINELKALFEPHFASTSYYHIVSLSSQPGDLDKLGMTSKVIKEMLWKRLSDLPPEKLHQHEDFLDSLGKHLFIEEWKPIVLEKTKTMSILAIASDMRSFIEKGILVPADHRKEQQTLEEEAIAEVSKYQSMEQLRNNAPTYVITDRFRIDRPTKKHKPILFEKGFLSPNTPAIVRLVTAFVRDNSRSYIAPRVTDPFYAQMPAQREFAAASEYITFCELMPPAIPPLLEAAKKGYETAFKTWQEAQAAATTRHTAARAELDTKNAARKKDHEASPWYIQIQGEIQNAKQQLTALQTAYDTKVTNKTKIEDYLNWKWDLEKKDLQNAALRLKDGTPGYERACEAVTGMNTKKVDLQTRLAQLNQANNDLLTKHINPWKTYLSERETAVKTEQDKIAASYAEQQAAIDQTLRSEQAAAQATLDQAFTAINAQFLAGLNSPQAAVAL